MVVDRDVRILVAGNGENLELAVAEIENARRIRPVRDVEERRHLRRGLAGNLRVGLTQELVVALNVIAVAV